MTLDIRNIPENPYDIIKDMNEVSKLNSFLGISDTSLFETFLKTKGSVDMALGTIVSNISGAVNPGGVLGWMKLIALKENSRVFLREQLMRLSKNPRNIRKELSLSLVLFSCMGHEMETWTNHQKRMSDVGRLAMGLFSSKKMNEFEETIVRRSLECVRWVYMSSIILIFHYIKICRALEFTFEIDWLKEASAYIAYTLFPSADCTADCIVLDCKNLLSDNKHYVHDFLCEYPHLDEKFFKEYSLSAETRSTVELYCVGTAREDILKLFKESN